MLIFAAREGQGKLTHMFSAERHQLSAFRPSPHLLVPRECNIGAESGSGKSLRKAENVYVGLHGPPERWEKSNVAVSV